MDDLELSEFRKIFDSIDTSDPAALRRWFTSYPELSAREHAQIIGRAPTTIRAWRRRCRTSYIYVSESYNGTVFGYVKYPRVVVPKKPIPNIVIPPDWDDEWLVDRIDIDRISFNQLAKLVGMSRPSVTRRYKLYKKRRPVPGFILEL